MLGLACFLLLQILNPHALIARVNLDRVAAGAEYDGEYLVSLGGDAVPILLARLNELPEEERCSLSAALKERWSGEKTGGWRSWNLGDARARALVADLQPSDSCTVPVTPVPGGADPQEGAGSYEGSEAVLGPATPAGAAQ
jgi:hypothetical protein